ncbi:hypothetical protein NPIL_564281 [Nephila pilipes]|uniref:Uncharacterized protein n=1 Tax=Nephila pilipes TaxID=299642 RepID=A0A8X6U6A2_NEPPI|nr:hypothetical protein NPIL_564281 [Nephila pilipes]
MIAKVPGKAAPCSQHHEWQKRRKGPPVAKDLLIISCKQSAPRFLPLSTPLTSTAAQRAPVGKGTRVFYTDDILSCDFSFVYDKCVPNDLGKSNKFENLLILNLCAFCLENFHSFHILLL